VITVIAIVSNLFIFYLLFFGFVLFVSKNVPFLLLSFLKQIQKLLASHLLAQISKFSLLLALIVNNRGEPDFWVRKTGFLHFFSIEKNEEMWRENR
jgi:hypothetical protein